mmetsp:Transcript_23381/g.50622  ORF Transcript_23381/g.50622 Transcript_23381/m.50622 type:complete len:2207 (-) Transcript_23381:153-6773(-)|eukprot:CAMPEP_0172308418 /NCGR_PEP_ID=MMETSP1058-20130122/9013_1 /TAXON_ID=83371 /ORGANISM="Detonula confervacea, Strain CCMP 353" /LENGTH=2206 /DNA_ID=CAMNT_0013020827 /DNA_START=170 /DNA_END=6790 /DNA_ORIENTATION=+
MEDIVQQINKQDTNNYSSYAGGTLEIENKKMMHSAHGVADAEDATNSIMESNSIDEATANQPRCNSNTAQNQTNLQLEIIKNNFRFYHAWQPSSLESLDDEYYDNDAIANMNTGGHIVQEATTNNNVLLVKGLPLDLDNDNLKDFFSLFGQVSDTSVSRGVGIVTFEDGSDGAEKALASQPMKMFGETVEIELAVHSKDASRRGRRRLARGRAVPFPIVIAPPNYGPLDQKQKMGYFAKSPKKVTHAAPTRKSDKSSHDGESSESKGIFDKATQRLASAATKLHSFAQNQQPQHNGLLSSAPPVLTTLQRRKASLRSLLSSPMDNPLFDDDDDDEHFLGESSQLLEANSGHRWGLHQGEHTNHGGVGEEPHVQKKRKHFHSDNALPSWVWAPEQMSTSSSQTESDLSCALVRGRSVNAKLPLLSFTSGIQTTNDSAATCDSSVNQNETNEEKLVDNTNLNLLHKSIDVTVKKKNQSSPNHRYGGDEKDEKKNHETSDTGTPSTDGPYTLYQARHPCLAPLISVTKCTVSRIDNDGGIASDKDDNEKMFESVVSVFDITPSRHRSLHELLRTEDFLTQPLCPGAEGHEYEPLANDFIGPSTAKGRSWFRGAEEQNDGFCCCNKSSDQGDGWRDQHQPHASMAHSSSEPNLLLEKSNDEAELPSVNLFGDLRKLREGGAAIAARVMVDQPPPKFMRRRRPWKLFKVGSAYRADVADLRIRLLALQMFHAVSYCHSRGISLGEQLSPDRIFVQDDGWMRFLLPITSWKAESDVLPESKSSHLQIRMDVLTAEERSPKRQWRSIFRLNDGSLQYDKDKSITESILPYPGFGDVPMVQWQRGQLTNLCYLMMLNAAAGRTVGDQINPPILPWVTDFSNEIKLGTELGKFGASENSPWRDLSKSKFRLKKGDEQLDQTFAHASPPHHVPESICELTYTVYRARCLPIAHLRTTVRENFIAAHYPASVQTLYEWTPDEATLEFYVSNVQPCIFRSMHSGMNDLTLPLWCNTNVGAFIAYHRCLLESDYVSRELNLWIDLNFGEALSGKRAVAEKNCVLAAVPWANGGQDQCKGSCHSVFTGSPVDEKHFIASSLRQSRSRFVQLFSGPHPRKHTHLRKTVSSALRTAFNQNDKESDEDADAQIPPNNDVSDFQSRKQRDVSTIGAILKDCYCSARVIPPPAVDEAINKLLMGNLDLRQSLKDLDSDGLSTKSPFPFPKQLKDAYQVLSKVQNLTFRRMKNDSGVIDDNEPTTRSTNLEQVWRLIQNAQCLESLSSTCAGLILPTILHPLKSIDAFIENCIGSYYSSFTDRFHKYLVVLSRKICSVPFLFEFLEHASEYASNDQSKGQVITEELRKIFLSRLLIQCLYSSSSGESFVAQMTSFITKQLCVQATTPENNLLQSFTSLVSQDDTLGASICCKFIVPSLIHNIERSSIINQRNTIAQTLKSLVPFLPEDTIGILICKPILRNIIPSQLCKDRLLRYGEFRTIQIPDSSTTESLNLLKDLTVLLQSCLCHMDSNNIVKYYFQQSNSGTFLQLLSKSFEVSENRMKKESGPSCSNSSEELLKEASILVCDVIGRIGPCHYHEVFPVVEKFCSLVNDSYISIALHQRGDSNEVMSLPGINAARMISNKAINVCGRKLLELHCPSALEFLSWLNQARGIHTKPSLPPLRPAFEPLDEVDPAQQGTLCNDDLHEIIGGDGFEMRAPKRQTKAYSAVEDDDMSSSRSELVIRDESSRTSTSNGSMMDGIQHQEQTPSDQDTHFKSKQELAWVLGLHKVEKEESIRYLWQPRMMLATNLKDENSLARQASKGTHYETKAAITTSMSANQPESMLVAGNSLGEVLLFNLRRHPPVLKQKKQFGIDSGILNNAPPIRQVEFFDNDGNLLVCNGGLHLFNTDTETTLSSLSSKNTFRRNSMEARTSRKWKGDNFVGFSLFPKATGLGEILGDATGEFAAISSSYLYTIDVRCCGDSAANYQQLLWPDKDLRPKKSQFDSMFKALTWNTSSSLPREEYTESNKALQVRDDKTAFDLMCITTHVDWVCTGSSSGHIHCFDRRAGKLLSCWKGHAKSVEYLKAISRHRLLSVSGDKTAVLWDMTKTPPQKISSIYNIPGKEFAMNVTSHQFLDDGLVSIPGDNNLLLCAAAGRKAVFMPMPQEPQLDGQPTDMLASRIVKSDFDGNRISSAGKLNISSIALLPCRQLVLLGCEGEIHVCL